MKLEELSAITTKPATTQKQELRRLSLLVAHSASERTRETAADLILQILQFNPPTPEQKENIIGAVVVDMIGDRDLDIHFERNSDPLLNQEIWREADKLDYPEFHHSEKFNMFDDHIRLINEGIPTALLIDFEYGSAPGLHDYWHTQNDTLDKISGDSLEKVGRVLERFIYTKTG